MLAILLAYLFLLCTALSVIHKLGLVYFILKSLPPDLLSSLQSYLLLAVYKSDDAKTYGLDTVLRPIVEEGWHPC